MTTGKSYDSVDLLLRNENKTADIYNQHKEVLFGQDQFTCERAQTVPLPRREQEDKDDTAKNVALNVRNGMSRLS